jgi:phenylacetic acid degradation operon negative regulatory protein
VTNPYDIDEIFPGDDPGSVRLPRRQVGNSPQGRRRKLDRRAR